MKKITFDATAILDYAV